MENIRRRMTKVMRMTMPGTKKSAVMSITTIYHP
jgi:hypothetical protein